MDVIKVEIDNFCAIGHAELDLDNRGLLLVQGENQDDSSAKSNGAGKSSIVDAICWCGYGITARDESGDAIVNRTAKKDCGVVMHLLDDGPVSYRVERYRKHFKHKNQLYVWQLGATPADPDIPLHKGTERETQEVLTKIMGCSHSVFVGSIYAGQEQMPNLPGMTDKQLKLLVEEGAGVEELAEAYVAVSKDLTQAEKAAAVAASELAAKRTAEATAEEGVREAREQHQLFEDGRKVRAKAQLVNVPAIQALIVDVEGKLARLDPAALTNQKASLEARLAAVKSEQQKLAEAQDVEDLAHRNESTVVANLMHANADFKRAKEALTTVESKIGTPCGECGKPYCEHDIDAARTLRKSALLAAAKKAKAASDALKVAADQRITATHAVEAFKATMTDVSASNEELINVNEALHEVNGLTFALAQYKHDIENLKAAAKAKLTEPNAWKPLIEAREKALTTAKLATVEAEQALAKLTAQTELLADAVKVFGPAGVRAHILDTVTPFLNARTAEYLGSLADGNIHAIWSTLSTTAKGELREKFNIAVSNDHGGDTFKLQSGGEKRKVRLACAMALQDMVASRATKPIRLFLADEIDEALDEPGLERLMTVLDTKAKERGTVLVISHRSLTDWIDQIVTVTKSAGKAVLTGSNVRTF